MSDSSSSITSVPHAIEPTHGNSITVAGAPAWLDTHQYPFASKRFAHADGDLHYVDEGEGEPLLFVHGTPSWSFEWRAAIAYYRERYRCIAVDHLGFGLSDKPLHGSYLPSDHTRRLHDVVRGLDLRDVTLVVHDFGGPIATPLVVRDPARFRRVVLVNTWVWPLDEHVKGRLLMRFVRSALGRFLYIYCNVSPRMLLPAAFAKRTNLTPSLHRHYLAPFSDRSTRIGLWTLGANLVDSAGFAVELPAVIPALRKLPTAIVWGLQDAIVGADVLLRARHLLPQAITFELEGVGHFPQEEAPFDFLRAMDGALAG